jgi:glycine/D-amino acid oxidase-like deaminating enzyme
MRILVLGGGIAGVTAAYFLAKDGHEVALVEEQESVGREASAANAGIIAPGHSFAWASPTAPGMLLRSLLGQETAIRVRPRLDPALFAWGFRKPISIWPGSDPGRWLAGSEPAAGQVEPAGVAPQMTALPWD